MLREYIFRGISKKTNEFIFGNAELKLSHSFISQIDTCEHVREEVYNETINQFSGHYDSNDNKIFEGDIISFASYDDGNDSFGYTGIVYFCNMECTYNVNGKHYNPSLNECTHIHIIGNIYQSSEALINWNKRTWWE